MMFLSRSFFFLFCVQEKEEFKITVTEKGTKVEERIVIDKKKNTERFHVPSHNGADEADVLNDFNQVFEEVKYN